MEDSTVPSRIAGSRSGETFPLRPTTSQMCVGGGFVCTEVQWCSRRYLDIHNRKSLSRSRDFSCQSKRDVDYLSVASPVISSTDLSYLLLTLQLSHVPYKYFEVHLFQLSI